MSDDNRALTLRDSDAGTKARARRGGGPRLSIGEWVALIVLYRVHADDLRGLKAAFEYVSDRMAARAGGVASARAGTRLRSPSGLRRRLTVVRAIEAGSSGQQPLQARDAMKMVLDRPVEAVGLAAEVLGYVPGSSSDLVFPELEADVQKPTHPSRGPTPTWGPVSFCREGGESRVYVMRLVGRSAGRLYDGDASKIAIKVGHSADPLRRRKELERGLPPACGLEWRLECERCFASADAAYEFEQRLLGALWLEGLTIGGEFARMPAAELPRWLAAVASK